MEIKKVLVIGAGQMGNGIAQVMLQGGLDVVMQDIDQKFVDKGMANIAKNLGKWWKKANWPKRIRPPCTNVSAGSWNWTPLPATSISSLKPSWKT